MAVLLSSAYLAPISFYVEMARHSEVYVEQYDHYVKQTYRNRCVIAAEKGPLSLTVPTQKSEKAKYPMKDVRISDHGNWQRLHWNAIESAYRGTPFFEYYQDDFSPFYREKFTFLFDFNRQLCELVCRLTDLHPQFIYTEEYRPMAQEGITDCRDWIEPNHIPVSSQLVAPYYQVFAQRNGFLPNLSIMDLLFNMGPESLIWLTGS